jgi:hypothetical protein
MAAGSGGRPWWVDERGRLAREQAAMSRVAHDLVWDENLRGHPGSLAGHGGGWSGPVPFWPFERAEPAGLRAFLRHPLQVRILCGEAYPMSEPRVEPIELALPEYAIGWTEWHLTPTKRLCLLTSATAWDPAAMVADLIGKVSGWYIEYRLMLSGQIRSMTERGIESDPRYDAFLATYRAGHD